MRLYLEKRGMLIPLFIITAGGRHREVRKTGYLAGKVFVTVWLIHR
jgi:hypothetical protein